MKYRTTNELENFDFAESVMQDIQLAHGFYLILDNVKIKPENSCNRDIRMMRCNQLHLHLENPTELKVIEEGNKIYNANGELQKQEEDRLVDKEEYQEVFEGLLGCTVYHIVRRDKTYELILEGDEHSYCVTIQGESNWQEWDRFLNLGW